MKVLVDTSVWIDYFRGSEKAEPLDLLLEQNVIYTNDLILAELVPYLKLKNQKKVIKLLQSISKLELKIDWDEIAKIQYKCLKAGINGIGIPELIIAQNVRQNTCQLYTLDKHFQLIKDIVKINLFYNKKY
jgi:predicted nucleic acid-binding protein